CSENSCRAFVKGQLCSQRPHLWECNSLWVLCSCTLCFSAGTAVTSSAFRGRLPASGGGVKQQHPPMRTCPRSDSRRCLGLILYLINSELLHANCSFKEGAQYAGGRDCFQQDASQALHGERDSRGLVDRGFGLRRRLCIHHCRGTTQH